MSASKAPDSDEAANPSCSNELRGRIELIVQVTNESASAEDTLQVLAKNGWQAIANEIQNSENSSPDSAPLRK